MRKKYTRTFRCLILLAFVVCCSHISYATPCTTSAAWTDTIPSGDSVVFSAADTSSNVHHIWVFGDGIIDSSGATLSHVYASAGIYQVCQYVYIPNTPCADTLCLSILVGDTCGITAAWTSVGLGGDSVRFMAADTSSTATHLWKFSDGGFVFGTTSTVHQFPAPGIYTACFYVYRGSCTDSLCQAVTVSSDTCGILATWSYADTNGDTVNFSASNTDTTVTHRWNFGDGTFASGPGDTTHVYAGSGFYTACLYLHKLHTNCYDTLCQSIAVGNNPCHITAAWTYNTHGGDSARFTAADTNSSAQYQYTFGDGTYATGARDTTHQYAAPGTYYVCFYAFIPYTSCLDSSCGYVTVTSDSCGLTAAWSASSLGGDSLRFIAADTNSQALHIWDFGDGSLPVIATDTTHRYDTAGTFTVCLYVHVPGTDCYDTLCLPVVSGTPPCDITAAWNSYGLGGDSVAFYASDTNSLATHLWNFGDGSLVFNTIATNHTYTSAGTYHVCFYSYVAGTNCSDSLCQDVTIAVDTCHITPEWTASVLGGDSVSLQAADTNIRAHHVWNFGDGSPTSDTTATKHTYAAPGTYHICLYVYKTGAACSDSLCQDVTVTTATPCHIIAAWTSGIVGNDSIRFIASDTNSAATHVWKFGDGTSVTGTTNTIHHYAGSGTYQVCFYSYIPGTNCSDSLCQSVQVTGNAACNITAAWTYTTVGNDSISFLAADTNRTAIHMWTFGDGSRVTGTTATIHHYAAAGTYTVCFYSYIPGTACSDTLCQSVTVTGSSPCPITAAWTYSSVGSDSISFIAADTNTGAVHIWNFGDGTAAGTTAPIHHYAAQGNYTVCFYVYIPGTGCSDTLCQSVQVGQPCDITAAWTYQTYQYGDSISCTAADTNASADHIWHLNGSTIVNGRHLELAFQAGGTYEICLYVYIQNTYCFDSLCQAVNISAGLSALSEEMPAITVMPNPFGQHTLIRVDGAIEPYELNIYDLVGKNVGHETSSSNVFNFGRGNLAPGIYIYEVILKGAAIGKGKIEAE